VVFSIAIGIYTRVTQSGFSLNRSLAQQQMKKIVFESIDKKDWENTEQMVDSILYKKIVTPYAGYSDLLFITVEADQQGKKIGEYKQIVNKSEHEIQQ
jgi:hypothetical protein